MSSLSPPSTSGVRSPVAGAFTGVVVVVSSMGGDTPTDSVGPVVSSSVFDAGETGDDSSVAGVVVVGCAGGGTGRVGTPTLAISSSLSGVG